MSTTIREDTIIALAWKFLERVMYQIASLLVQIVLARLLSPREFGVMAIVLVFITLSNAIVQTGLSNAIVQAKECSRKDYASVLMLSLILSAFIYIIIYVFSPLIGEFYSQPEIAIYLRVLSIVLFINSFIGIQNAHALREMNTKAVFKATVSGAIISGVCAIASAFFGFGIWALVVQTIVMQVASSITLAVADKWVPPIAITLANARNFWVYGWKITASGLLFNGYQNAFDLIIGKSFSTNTLGLFSQGRRIPFVVSNSFDGSIQSVMLAALSRLADDTNAFKQALRRAIKTSVLVTSPVMLAMAALASQFIPVVFGDSWIDAIPYFRIFAIGYSLVSISSTNQQALNARGRSDILLLLELLKTIIGLSILMVTLIGFHDSFVTAIGASVFLILSTFINSYPNAKMIGYPFRDQIADILPSYTIALVVGFLSWSIADALSPNLLNLFICIVTYIIAYIFLILVFKVEAAEYLIKTIKSIVFERRKR